MFEQIGNTLRFLGWFVASKEGKSGLPDVLVDVYNPSNAKIISDGASTEVGGGIYSYTLTSNYVSVEGEYTAVFKTSDGTVDARHVFSVWNVGRGGVEALDSRISNILATPVPGSFLPGTAGHILGTIGSAEVIALGSALLTDGTLTLVRGDTYSLDESRALMFSSDDWPDITNSAVTMTMRRRREAFGNGSDAVLFTVNDVANSRVTGGGTQQVVFELSSNHTTALIPGESTGKFDIEAVLDPNTNTEHKITLILGVATVLEDQTRI